MPPTRPIFKPSCGPGLSPSLNPAQFRDQIYTSPSSQRVRWFEAFPDPSFDQETGISDTRHGHGAIRYAERMDARAFRALIVPANRGNERHFPQGSLTTGSILVHSMPDELPLSQHDIICPIGQTDTNGLPDAAWDVGKETIVRGSGPRLPGAGTVSVFGATVTGMGTQFTTFVRTGDILFILDEPCLVAVVQSDTSLLLLHSPEQSASGCSYEKATDSLRSPIAFLIDELRTGTSTLPAADYELSPGGDAVCFKKAVTAPRHGHKYGVRYRYYPRYMVRDDLGVRPPPVAGAFLPQTVIAERMGNAIEP